MEPQEYLANTVHPLHVTVTPYAVWAIGQSWTPFLMEKNNSKPNRSDEPMVEC